MSPVRSSVALTSKYSVVRNFSASSRLRRLPSRSTTARGMCLTSKFRAKPNTMSRKAGMKIMKTSERLSLLIWRTSFRMTGPMKA